MIPNIRINAAVDDRIFFTSLGSATKHFYYQDSSINKIRFLNIPKNASQFVRNSFPFFKNNTGNPISFSIIREPRERFISMYKYAINVIESFDTLVEILKNNKNIDAYEITKVGVEHLLPQTFFVDNAPKEWKSGCQLITMDNFFANGPNAGLQSLGIEPSIDLPNIKVNSTDDYPENEYYELVDKIDNQYKEFFDDYFAQDIELYEKAVKQTILSS